MTRKPAVGALLCALLAVAALPGAAATPIEEDEGPEDVPAGNMFDPARMRSTLVVPRTPVTHFKTRVIDAHSHAYAETPEAVTAWVALQKELSVEQTFIFTGKTGTEFNALVARYAGAYPRQFLLFAGMLTENLDAPDYGERLRESLRADVKAGARGLGELTDKGLGLVRVGDHPYYIDDERFDPLWDEAARLHVPVFVHIAEPAAFYEPADERNELRRSANWSLHDKGTPGFESMIGRFERVLSKHRGTTFVAVHAFNLANDLGRVDSLLRAHPNVLVDFAARMWELGRQPYSARRFIVKNADRVLFGTDNDPRRAMYIAHARQLETEDEWFWPADAEWWRGYGMHLPPAVLDKVYRRNAQKLLAAHRD